MSAKYPELEKMAEKREEINHIMDFISFLSKQDIVLGEWLDSGNGIAPISNTVTPEKLAAKFYGIDMKVVEKERQELLQTIHN